MDKFFAAKIFDDGTWIEVFKDGTIHVYNHHSLLIFEDMLDALEAAEWIIEVGEQFFASQHFK